MRDEAIGFALRTACAVPECPDVAAWWPRHREAAQTWRNPLDLALAAGFSSERVGWAFASGDQAALHALFPGAPEDRICAFCVTEAEGNHPCAIRSSFEKKGSRRVLNGAKRWTTPGPDGALFFVAARDATGSGERPKLRVARVASDLDGMKVRPMPPTRFVPEGPHAQLEFENVLLEDEALLPGDGYEAYVRPFRTVEDIHVHAAIVAYLVREARSLGWPGAWVEGAAAQLHALRSLAAEDPSSPATHVALAGALAGGAALIRETDEFWKLTDLDPAAARWRRDKELLSVAGKARAQRAARAWERLRPSA